jgi:riboflavin kinase/FMN adenylyltransferase
MPAPSSLTKPFVIVRDGEPAGSLAGAVVAIGNFDGVHRGHRRVIAGAKARARALGRPAAALTFEPHPRSFLAPAEPLFRLADARNKLRLLAGAELDGAIVLTFDAALAELSAQAFVGSILVQRCRISGAVIGHNFYFGKNRAGSPDFFTAEAARGGFTLDIVDQLEDGGRPVSSGQIRAAIEAGRMADAAELLGFPWFVSGTVIHGDHRGRDLGFPTANLRLDPGCRLRHGIYAVRVGRGAQRLDGVASFGRRPTFDDGAPLLEVFLFDFTGDLYGATLDVAFLDWIREELRFANVADLIRQMNDDSRKARELLARLPDLFPPLGEIAE